MCVADVQVSHRLPSVAERTAAGRAKTTKDEMSAGKYILSLLGESSGQFLFSLSTIDALLQVGSITAHRHSAVVAIACTAHAALPTFRLQLSPCSSHSDFVEPQAGPGGAVVTMSAAGEVKVWQPVFTSPHKGNGSRSEDVFIVFELSWKTSGLFFLPTTRQPSTLALSPCCMHVLVGFKGGGLAQYPVPGLVPSSDGRIDTCRSDTWSFAEAHGRSVDGIRVCCNGNGLPTGFSYSWCEFLVFLLF